MRIFENELMNKVKRHNAAVRVTLSVALMFLCISATYVWTEITEKEFTAASDKSSAFYKDKEHYSVKVVHTSYRGHNTETPYEHKDGYYRYDHGNYHSYLAGIHTIQNDKYRIVIDTAAKSILVGDVTGRKAEDISETNYRNSMKDVKKFLKASVGTATRYRLEYNDKPMYEAYEVEYDANGMMREMDVFYRTEYAINPNDPKSPKAKPRLKITWSEFNEKIAFAADEFDTGKIFTELNGKLTPSPKYKGYRITDVRVKK